MKFQALLLIVALAHVSAIGQAERTTAKPRSKQTAVQPSSKKKPAAASKTSVAKRTPLKPKAASTPEPRDEKAAFEAAISADPLEKVNALKKFIVDFPQSERAANARELLVVARAAVADEKLRSGDAESGIVLFKLAVEEAPDPIPDRLFAEVISKFPYSLYWNGQRPAALDTAALIEARVIASAPQLVLIANFYASIENGAEAMRVAEAALQADPNSSTAYQTIGLAHRLNFDLERSAAAYSKALELDPTSLNSKQSLAEMNRALGKPDEAEKLYREMLAVAQSDIQAQTGLVLSLFDGGKRADAEAEMAKSLENNPKNVILLAGASYWYASNGDADKAIELGEKAIALEPRYVWSYIALARGLMGKQKAVDAERVLIKARSYGNFPTVEYELASARIAAGFYREAADGLQKSFTVEDGIVRTKLGGRIERTAANFGELLAAERRASIFTPTAANDTERDLKLEQLLDLHKKLGASEPSPDAVAAAVDEFTSGTDVMKVHRQLYAASALLQKNIALDKVTEVALAAIGNTDAGLNTPNAAAAVMASELYDSRSLAFMRNEFLAIPEVPRQTLSVILRGRVEDVAGWAFYQQNNYPEAILRLRRAVSVLPDKSAWWRASTWHLGAALAADGKEKDALDAYIASYKTDKPDLAKYAIVESLYKRLNNGSTDGLEEQLGKERVVTVAEASIATPTPSPAAVDAQPPEGSTPASGQTTLSSPETAAPVRIPRGVPIDRTAVLATPAAANETLLQVETPSPAEESTKAVSAIREGDRPKDIEPQPPTASPKQDEAPAVNEPKQEPPAVPAGLPVDPQPKDAEKSKTEPGADPAADLRPSEDAEKLTPQLPAGGSAGKTEKTGEIKEVKENPLEEGKTDVVTEKVEAPEPATSESASVKAGSKPPDEPPPKIEANNKPIFEPIIITIPSAKRTIPNKDREPGPAGAARPRIIEGIEIKAEEIPACKIDVSQENISLINNGGTIGLIVTLDDELTAKQLIATSNSPGDVEIKSEPDLGQELAKQRLFIIRSVSTAPGVYQLRFAAACGRKDVMVTVR